MNSKWIKYHVIFFAITWVFNYFFNFYPTIPLGRLLPYSLFFVVDYMLLVVCFYAMIFIAPFFLKKIILFIPSLIAFIILGCFILSIVPYYFHILEGSKINFSQVYFMKMFEVTYFKFSALAFFFLQKWEESSNQKMKLIESSSEAELIFLRSQMSPHFLLNTLNSIYSLALNNSPQTYPAISELKTIYSYIQREDGKVTLKDEIDYLQNFINMQKRRFGNSVSVNVLFSIDGEYTIEPLLLSSFVENAFKHGVSMKEPSFINVKLLVYNGDLEYEVENSNHSAKFKDKTSGIGLQNLNRRLELLYGSKAKLKQHYDSMTYTAVLTIKGL
jgi:two-component system LytT family sensor kinase